MKDMASATEMEVASGYSFEVPTSKLLNGDCISLMSEMPDNSVDLIFADPPYNLQIGDPINRPDKGVFKGVDQEWDKFDTFATYDAFSIAWLKQARRLLKPDGAIWVMGSYHNIFRIGCQLQDIGFWIMNDVTWIKANPTPNFRGTRFTNATETLIWAAKSQKSNPVFEYNAAKLFNDDKQMRSDWVLPICSGKERVLAPDGSGSLHPTQKPEALLYRALMITTRPGDVVLDPFSGTGTTGSVCKKLGRNFIGIERDQSYFEAAKSRISQVEPLDLNCLTVTQRKRKLASVPIGALIEAGLLEPGVELYGRQGVSASLRVDGSLSDGKQSGSIHSLASALDGKESVNGWDFWFLDPERKVSIDTLRHEFRKKITENT